MNIKKLLLTLSFSIMITTVLSGCSKKEITLDDVVKAYSLSYSPGATSAEEAFDNVVKAIISDNFDDYLKTTYNYDIVVYKSLERKFENYEKVKVSGNTEKVEKHKNFIDALISQEKVDLYKKAEEPQVNQQKQDFQRLVKTFSKYIDPKTIDTSKIEPSRHGSKNTDIKKTLFYYFANEERQKDAYVSLSFETFNGKWYYNGSSGAGIL